MNIKQLRIDIGITQKQLCNLIGVKQSAISKWESGKSNPSADKLPEIAKVLNCKVDDLFKKM